MIAEKPSVGRDLARVLPGPFAKHEGYLEGPEHVISWAVGHLVQLAEPDEYDPKFKRWRMADLPIVPTASSSSCATSARRSRCRWSRRQLHRDDVAEVINACDAGREGELIFAYLFEKARPKLPVRRLWLSSMTTAGDARRVRGAAPRGGARAARAGRALALGGRLDRRHERDACRDDPPALARSTAPSRSDACRRRRSRSSPAARRRSAPSQPEPYWLVDARFEPSDDADAPLRGPLPRRRQAADRDRGRRRSRSWPRCAGTERRDHQGREARADREAADALRPHLAAARRQHALRLLGAAHARPPRSDSTRSTRRSPIPRTNSRFLTSDMAGEIKPIAELRRGARPSTAPPRATSRASTCCRSRASSTTRR